MTMGSNHSTTSPQNPHRIMRANAVSPAPHSQSASLLKTGKSSSSSSSTSPKMPAASNKQLRSHAALLQQLPANSTSTSPSPPSSTSLGFHNDRIAPQNRAHKKPAAHTVLKPSRIVPADLDLTHTPERPTSFHLPLGFGVSKSAAPSRAPSLAPEPTPRTARAVVVSDFAPRSAAALRAAAPMLCSCETRLMGADVPRPGLLRRSDTLQELGVPQRTGAAATTTVVPAVSPAVSANSLANMRYTGDMDPSFRVNQPHASTGAADDIRITIDNHFAFPVRVSLYLLLTPHQSPSTSTSSPNTSTTPISASASASASAFGATDDDEIVSMLLPALQLKHASSRGLNRSSTRVIHLQPSSPTTPQSSHSLNTSSNMSHHGANSPPCGPEPPMVQCLSFMALPQTSSTCTVVAQAVLRVEATHGWFRSSVRGTAGPRAVRTVHVCFEYPPHPKKEDAAASPQTGVQRRVLSVIHMVTQFLGRGVGSGMGSGDGGKCMRATSDFVRHSGACENDWNINLS